MHSGFSVEEFPRVPYDANTTILELFRKRVAESPDRIAVVFGAETLTYRQLDGKANALAAELTAAGVSRGDLTPLLVGDGPALPLAAIALMKLAAPFVPLDESWPVARIDTVLEQLDPKAVVCTPALTGLAESTRTGRPLLCLDPGRLDAAAAPVPMPGPTSDDLIYGFFTSGSTGVPKCALNAHLGLLNRFLTMTRKFADDGMVVLQNSRHVFDSSIWQLLWPLTTGATVVIPVRQGILDLNETVRTIARHGVTMTDFVPSIFNTLVAVIASDPQLKYDLRSLRRVLIGGEEISPRAVAEFRALLPGVRITNTYGPTECSIGSVFHEVGDEDPIPIGTAIDNTVALVLDADRRRVAPGEQGEIYVGGDCVGRGYLNDPEKTAAAFLPNPFPAVPGHLLYRTGDLGWSDENGLLHFAGRRDHQVKLNGVRVELAEVEAAFTQHAGVRDAKVVIAGQPGAQRLVAFVLPAAPLETEGLHAHLAELLPASSLPKDIVELAAFPLTPNGKTDRRALVELAANTSRITRAADPENDLERAIREVWSTILSTRVIGTTTSFFDAGGDSLSAQRLAVALRTVLGRTPSIREIVTHPTIRSQASLVDGARTEPAKEETDRLSADAVLPADIRRTAREEWVPGSILLTGATGFVGAHLLHELLVGTSEQVVCLVRAADRCAAAERIEECLRHYSLLEATPLERMVPVVGDLRKPRLGLEPAVYAELTASITTVVHGGAMVNLLLDYDAHRSTNVLGTLEVLRFVGAGRRKHLHHVSTLGVIPDGALGGERVTEWTEPLEEAIPSDGYLRSKWVAERLVLSARERGLESSVYRLGEVGPHSGTGVPSDRGLVDGLLCAAIAYGVFPDTAVSVDYTPVDHVARLVTAALIRGRVGGTYHTVQPTGVRLDELFRALTRWSPVERVPYGAFWQALGQAGEHGLRLRSVLSEPHAHDDSTDCLADVFSDASQRFATECSDRLVAEAGIVVADHDTVLDRYAVGCVERVHGWQRIPGPPLAARIERVGARG